MPKIALCAALAMVLVHPGFAQTYTIITVAGSGWDLPGALANLSHISGVAVDSAGNVFMALSAYSVVVRFDSNGQLSLVAGNGTQGFSGDNGPASLAQLTGPTALAADSAGNVYIADSGNNRIRMVSNGVISTVAGGGSVSPGDNGAATSAQLNLGAGYGPGLAVDSAGSFYFADALRVRKVAGGVITTLAGGGFGFGDNVSATSAFVDAAGVAVDTEGQVYFADTCSNRIRRVSSGVITTVAGNGTATPLACAQPIAGANSGSATGVPLDTPQGVAVDSAGNVYFTEGVISGGLAPSRTRKVSNGTITTVAGGFGGPPFGAPVSDDIPATSAVMGVANSIAVDTSGNLYISDEYWAPTPDGYAAAAELGRLRKVSGGVITTLAGASGDTGLGRSAQLNLPAGIALDSSGNLYIADSSNNIVRQMSNGVMTTVAGARAAVNVCDCASSPALNAGLNDPQGVAADSAGDLYIAQSGEGVELSHGVVMPVTDTVIRVAGVAVDLAGNLYFADWTGNRIRQVSNGVIRTVAGDGTPGFGGDGGPATSAQLSSPSGIAVDFAGNVYFADTGNQRVRKISGGLITTVAGNGTAGFSGDEGPATSAQLNLAPLVFPPPLGSSFLSSTQLPQFPQLPTGIALDASGNLYIVDPGNQRVRKVSNGSITTIAGTGTPGFSGDSGPGASAQLNNPSGIAVDAAANVLISDSSNGRIRELIPPTCTYEVSPSSVQSSAAGGTFPVTIQTDARCFWVISGFQAWTSLDAPPSATGNARVVVTVAANSGASRIANMVVAGQSVTVTQAPAHGFEPVTSLVANAFGEAALIAPNTWVAIEGSNLAPAGDARVWQAPDFFVTGHMPTALDGVSVTMNGKNAYVYYISAGQINVLTPPDLALGTVQVNVMIDGVTSAAFTVPAQQYAPSFFVFAGGPYVTAVHQDSSLIGPASLYPGFSTPATPGETITLYANGFGLTSVPVVSGAITQTGSLPALPDIKIGGLAAKVQFAGLVSPGLFQFNVVVPASAADGDSTITASYNGAGTQPGTLLTIRQ